MCQWGANSNPWAHPRPPYAPLTPQTGGGGQKARLWNCSQIGDHRLSTWCEVVERPDHHCGDDLVTITVIHSLHDFCLRPLINLFLPYSPMDISYFLIVSPFRHLSVVVGILPAASALSVPAIVVNCTWPKVSELVFSLRQLPTGSS